tara:strand:+ start:11842 stop:12558 length:717 start_codon:yes stop_codon:yes gene_type:complete
MHGFIVLGQYFLKSSHICLANHRDKLVFQIYLNMKIVLFALSLLTFSAFSIDINPVLEIGENAPMADHKMMDVSGETLSLDDIQQENGLLVVFSCNTCPFVVGGRGEGWEGRYNELYDQCQKLGIGMVLVNSNEAKRGGDDSLDNMKTHAKQEGYSSYYVVDEKSALADAFGARTTPHIYMFNNKMQLVYKGAIDDNVDSSAEVKQPWLSNAISNLAGGKKINPNSTRNSGCSIKRVK